MSRRFGRRGGFALAGVGIFAVAAAAAVWIRDDGGGEAARAVPATTTSTSTTTTSTTTTTLAPYPTATPVPIAPGPVAPVISVIPTTNRVVFFTIDDGLVQDPAVLDSLRQSKLPVTMFILPGFVNQNPPYFQTIQALGASVQDHTVTHRELTKLSYQTQVQEICGSLDGFAATFGRRPWLFRPPYGAFNQATLRAARTCGLQAVIMWEGTMNDGRLDLQHPGPLRSGDIILMHFRPDLRQNLDNLSAAAFLAGLRAAPLEQYLPAPPGQ